MEKTSMAKIGSEMFEVEGKNLEAAQELKRPSLSFAKDAVRRLKKNKMAMASLWILGILIFMSVAGPWISKAVSGHTYRRQDLSQQNQTMFMNNKRSLKLRKNQVLKYKKYNYTPRKTKLTFSRISLKGTGKIAFQVGKESEYAFQGDKKEYMLEIETQSGDNIASIVSKLNEASRKLLEEDPDFRGVTFKKQGNKLVVASQGDSWFNTRYWLGTDEFGRDIFTRLWEGGRVSFLIAFLSVMMTILFGIIYGGISGYIGGKLDIVMMRIIEILMVIPSLLYIILLLTVMEPGMKPITIVLAITSWMGTARIVRGEVLRLKHSEYVIAAETLGAGTSRIIFLHLIPNIMGPIIVNMTMMIPRMIFAEAFLSFIGLGVPAPFASWGSLVNEGAKIFTQSPHQLFIPALALSLTMLAFNILGDGLRDALDPRLRK